MSTDPTIHRPSPTARAALEGAAAHPNHLVELPALPMAARNGVIRSMLRARLIEEIKTEGEAASALRATPLGLQAVTAQPVSEARASAPESLLAPGRENDGASPPRAAETAVVASEAPAGHKPVRATALLAAWDAEQGVHEALAALRAALAHQERPGTPRTPRRPRTDTKNAQVLALLGRTEGATIAQVIELTGWAPHTVCGFLAGLKRKAISVEVLERVRQVGTGKQGTKGSYSVYRIAVEEAG